MNSIVVSIKNIVTHEPVQIKLKEDRKVDSEFSERDNVCSSSLSKEVEILKQKLSTKGCEIEKNMRVKQKMAAKKENVSRGIDSGMKMIAVRRQRSQRSDDRSVQNSKSRSYIYALENASDTNLEQPASHPQSKEAPV